MRSLLLVTAENDAGLDRALAAGADAIVVNMPESQVSVARAALRRQAAGFVAARRDTARLFVRIGPLSSGHADDDLDAIVPARPYGIVLPRSTGGADILRLSAMLRPREALAGIDDGAIAVIAMAADAPAGLFGLGTYRDAGPRLVGIGWNAKDLAEGFGGTADTDRDAARLARTLTVAGAAAAGVAAIDTACPDGRTGLEPDAHRARADGFTGKFANDPDEVAVINRIFAGAAPNK